MTTLIACLSFSADFSGLSKVGRPLFIDIEVIATERSSPSSSKKESSVVGITARCRHPLDDAPDGVQVDAHQLAQGGLSHGAAGGGRLAPDARPRLR